MEKITKIFVGEIRSFDEKNKTVRAVVSDQSIDRYGEVILASAYTNGLDNYKKNPVLLSSHNYGSLKNIIGKAEELTIGKKDLEVEFKYFVDDGNSEADWGWKLASKYKIAAFSVGFLPKKSIGADWEKDGEDIMAGKVPRRTYTEVELLEVSQVTVPANPNAVGKSIDEDNSLDDTSKAILKEYFETIKKEFTSEDSKEPEVVIVKEDELVKELKELLNEFIKDFNAYKERQSEKMDKLLLDLAERQIEKENLKKTLEDSMIKEMEYIATKEKEVKEEVTEVKEKELEDKELADKLELEEKTAKDNLKKILDESTKKLKDLFVISGKDK